MASMKLGSWWSGLLPVCVAVGLSGCAGKPPTATLAQADLAVQNASQTRAPQYAALELQRAREQLESAKHAIHEKEYDKARRLAENALVNARLAEAKAEAEETRQAAAALQKSIQSLRQEAQQ